MVSYHFALTIIGAGTSRFILVYFAYTHAMLIPGVRDLIPFCIFSNIMLLKKSFGLVLSHCRF